MGDMALEMAMRDDERNKMGYPSPDAAYEGTQGRSRARYLELFAEIEENHMKAKEALGILRDRLSLVLENTSDEPSKATLPAEPRPQVRSELEDRLENVVRESGQLARQIAYITQELTI